MSSSGSYNRNRNRESPSTPVSARPRSNSKNSSESSQKNRNATVNGKMPSVANSPASGPDHLTDGVSNLTLDNIRYPIGSKVTAKLSRGGTIMKGEVVAYDPAYKVVIIKSSGSRPGRNNVTLLNLAHCSEMKIDEEGKDAPVELQSLNTIRLEQRTKDSVEKKKKLIMAFKAGISPEGQRLFQVINKTLDDVMWNGEKIRVMGVDIEPPYRPENIKSSPDNKALNHIRKIVEKHYRDLEAAKSSASSTPSALSVTSQSAATTEPASTPITANSRTTPTVTPSMPNLPQAPAPPSSSASSTSSHTGPSNKGPSNFRSNRNNTGRNYNRHHQDNHPKPMYNN
jgi:small nuclear ribonucleoprotein (snRNP)-like protein